MPRYIYECQDCLATLGENPTDEMLVEHALFETTHAIHPTPQEFTEATTCPRCRGTNCKQSFSSLEVTSFIRGYGYRDKVGMRRDMDLYHLTNDDPYGQYRVDGEVEDLKVRMKKKGKHDPKTKYFQTAHEREASAQSMEKAVEKSVHKKI